MGGYGIGRCMDEYAKVLPKCQALEFTSILAFCRWGACEWLDMNAPLIHLTITLFKSITVFYETDNLM